MVFDLGHDQRRGEPVRSSVPGNASRGPGAASVSAWYALALASPAPAPTGFQAKSEVGAADDADEREADVVAERVLRMPGASMREESGTAVTGGAGGDHASAHLRPSIATAPRGDGARASAPASVWATLATAGRPLDPPVRAFFEPRFGRDLAGVRIHTDRSAAASARDLRARAYTLGGHIAFAQGRYSPGTVPGRHLLAHELTHTVQQGAGGAERPGRLSARRVMRVPEVSSSAPEAGGGESAPEVAEAALTPPQSAAQIMRGLLSENILIDWWEHDCRDNNDKAVANPHPGLYDEDDPGERGFANHINVTKPGFQTISGRPCLGEGGTSVNIQDFQTSEPVKYSVCARVLSETYRQAGLRGFPLVSSVRAIIGYFRDHQHTHHPHTSFWLHADFPGNFLEGDFICSFNPQSQHGHAGMVVQAQAGFGLPLVVHLPGTTQRIWSGANNGIAPYDPRRLSDMTLERWPQGARPIYGIGRYHHA